MISGDAIRGYIDLMILSLLRRAPSCAYELARRIRAGTVTMNGGGGGPSPWAPFGGYKQSGVGREMGVAGFEEYLETKTIAEPA